MQQVLPGSRLTPKLIDSLYTEAMLLADEVRGYFDDQGRGERDALDPLSRVRFSCESLKVTTRLMHVIAWLLTHRAVEAGELSAASARHPDRRLGTPAGEGEEPAALDGLPLVARALIQASRELYERARRLDEDLGGGGGTAGARELFDRLERSF